MDFGSVACTSASTSTAATTIDSPTSSFSSISPHHALAPILSTVTSNTQNLTNPEPKTTKSRRLCRRESPEYDLSQPSRSPFY
ncbi:hypothetical protein CCACVL1_21340 [Corchorus capsularis]|uniref:Uncharacterized protein n=1 Tax=Corchorus capsularis TaxID=210143 RepID=A0A1R3H6H1_COCAP|nr:hypothetical protein CCACVL1_21340 [Corchorus capsularis]